MFRVVLALTLSAALCGIAVVAKADRRARARAAESAALGAHNSESWFRLQRTYPTGRVPPADALTVIGESLLPEPPAPGSRPQLSLPGEQWISIGPQPIFTQSRSYAGRVTAVAPHPTVASTIFIGTDSGGIWRTTDGGSTWTSLTDAIPVPAIQSLTLDPVNPQLLYATTIHRTYATRLLRSADGGATWSVSSITLGDGRALSPRLCSVNVFKACIPPSSGRILIDPRVAGSPNTSTIYYVGVSHLLRSDDSGQTFRVVLSLDTDLDFGSPEAPNVSPESEFVRDAAIDPARPDRLFVATLTARCENGTCTTTSGTVGVHRTIDAGVSWTRQDLATLDPFSPTAGTRYADPGAIYVPRLRAAVAPTDPDTVAIAIRDEVRDRVRLVKSVDGGDLWSELPGPANSVTWPLTLAFSPSDATTIYMGSAQNYRSTNGGQTWTRLDATHVDNIFMAFDANGTLLVGNDGGIWRSTGGTGMAPIHARLPITEFYSIAAHPTNPLLIAGGTQDNGNIVFQGNLGWSLYTGGDGGDTVWDPTPGSTTVYAEIEWFFFEGRQVYQFFRCEPGGCIRREAGLDRNDAGPFIPRILMDPTNASTLWLAVERMYVTNNRADSWSAASPSVANLERCWIDPVNGQQCAAARYFTAAAIAPTATQTVYGGTLNGDVRVTNDRGGSWRSIAGPTAGPLPVRAVNDIVVDPLDANTVYVSYSGFDSGGSGAGHVFRTTDGGGTWVDITGNLPDVPVNTLLIDPDSAASGGARVLYAGTDVGVWRVTLDGTTNWSTFGTGLPPVVVNRLAYSANNQQLLAATYGRGLYAITNRFSR